MGTKDITSRRLEEYNDVFADIVNVLVFNGERRVREDELVDIDTKSEIVADDKGLRLQERDVAKFWTKHNIKLALFGLENQAAADYQMPLRLYSYNGASYKAQLIPDKTSQNADSPRQPFYPVITLVLYFGFERWTAPRTLYEAVQIPEELQRFIPDIPINLVEVAWLEDEIIERFQSDFRIVARLFKEMRIYGKDSFTRQNPELQKRADHLLDTLRMLSAYSNDPRFSIIADKKPEFKEPTMLAALDYLENRGIEKGISLGRQEGTDRLNLLYAQLIAQNRNEELVQAILHPEILKKLMEEFGMSDDDNVEFAH